MKLFLTKGIYTIIAFFAFSLTARAQSSSPGFEVGAHASFFFYQGDLAPDIGSYKTPGFGVGLFGSYRFTQSLSVRANLALGNLRGDDAKYAEPAWREERNLNFSTSVTEVSGLLVWDFNRRNRSRLTPYVFAGLGYSFLDVKPDYSKATIRLSDVAEDQAHAKPENMLVIPVGGGVRYALSESLSLNAEGSYRLGSQTDYLDGVSLAGTPSKNDYYLSISVGVIYSLSSNGSNGNRRSNGGNRGRRSSCAAYQ